MTQQGGVTTVPGTDSRGTAEAGAQAPIIADVNPVATPVDPASDPRKASDATATPSAALGGATTSSQGQKQGHHGTAAGLQVAGQPPAKRARKREKEHEEQSQADFRWSLKRKIAALTRDVELLSHEVPITP